MPSQRQQRAGRNRRVVTAQNPQLTPALVPQIVSQGAHILTMQCRLYPSPATSTGSTVALQLFGIPSIVRVSTGDVPTAASISSDNMLVSLTYGGAALAPTESYRTSPADPALRTATGGFVSATEFGQEGGIINVETFTPSLVDPNTVLLSWADIGIPVTVQPLQFQHIESGTGPLTATASAPLTMTLTFAATISLGEHIAYTGATIFAAPVTAITFTPDAQLINS